MANPQNPLSVLHIKFPCLCIQFTSVVGSDMQVMDCKTCEQLLAAYRDSVSLFKNAVRKGSGAVRDDLRLTGKKAEQLGRQCKDASDAFMDHWRQHHGTGAKSGS